MRVIAGEKGGMTLKTPQGMDTRPTIERVKEALFSSVQFELPGMQVLDLFAGTGQLGIEALSRGAAHADFVDSSPKALALVRENLAHTGLLPKAGLYGCDFRSFLKSGKTTYDLILLDPPYGENFLFEALKTISEIDILGKDGIIIAEHPVDRPLRLEGIGLQIEKQRRYGTVLLTRLRKQTA